MKELNLESSGETNEEKVHNNEEKVQKNEEKKGNKNEEKVHKNLIGRRYLVVMDDMWSGEAWDVVRNVFPDNDNGSRVMLTTRLSDVASYPDSSSDCHEMRLMDADLSWHLLKKKVFTNEDCPSQLEGIGMEIARSCKGLPLAIVVIAGVLSTVSNNPASWGEIADKIKFEDTPEKGKVEQILSLSYTHLPQYLRPCFLYMGLFLEDHEIRVSKLTKLWIAEGFLKHPNGCRTLEDQAEACLEDLIKRSLALVSKRKWDGRIKTCKLHDLMRDLCIRKAYEYNFFLHMMDEYIDNEYFIKRTKDQRRISVRSRSLQNHSSTHGSAIHTILCSDTSIVVVNILKSVKLLRVLDAEPVDMCSMPSQLFELFHLRYLAFRCDNGILSTISKLQNLQTLIIHKEIQTSYVSVRPWHNMVGIWKMPQLRHIYSHVKIVLDEEGSTTLENLQTLAYLSHRSCTESIFKMIPNLKKLAIDCSWHYPPDEKAFLNNLVHLHQLENLEIHAGRRFEDRPRYYSFTFPMTLRKLNLRSLELPWDEINIVGSLPNLQVLKIREDDAWGVSSTYLPYVEETLPTSGFGETWVTMDGGFQKLELLLLERSNIEHWITETDHFPSLRSLMLHHCDLLHEIPQGIGDIPTLELIKVKGKMKESLEESLTNILDEQHNTYGNYALQVQIS